MIECILCKILNIILADSLVEKVRLSIVVIPCLIYNNMEYLLLIEPWNDLIVTLSTQVRLDPVPILYHLIHIRLPIINCQLSTDPSPTLPLSLKLCILDNSIIRQSEFLHRYSLLTLPESLL